MKHNATTHILMHTNRCIACGKCAEACPQGILNQINLLFHKHAHVERADLCIGRLKCVKACRQKAVFARRDKSTPDKPALVSHLVVKKQ